MIFDFIERESRILKIRVGLNAREAKYSGQ